MPETVASDVIAQNRVMERGRYACAHSMTSSSTGRDTMSTISDHLSGRADCCDCVLMCVCACRRSFPFTHSVT